MKLLKQKLLPIIGLLFISFVAIFTLSSKVDYTNPPPATNCDSFSHDTDEVVDIRIDFEQDGGYYNIPYRRTGYTDWWPYEDLRSGYPTPESSLANYNDSYYCIIDVTTPDCADWSWSTLIPSGGSKNMSIHIPKAEYGWDVVVNIKYYERCSDCTYDAYSCNGLVQYGLYSSNATNYLYAGPITYFYISPQQYRTCEEFDTSGGEISLILDDWWLQ